ncbi:RNA polymerase sigma factor [Parapedobacter indicus]|uniref:RNA polymerase sigma factor, sigma-70 family n=1 Tax=Parapedobacter indicus TaxID=1477437 RepID=A0A1I3H4I2_9SPHI|nr:sigma-70 family RNA polymerase sigma factor [Parapedobacter indicus]PPL02893.1 RNA polymerase sigma factor (sigma-70 family) [Parapedobacter indicus]SFI30591.1 RNA polymerase sigma factor, sigma-70 family [Parapedobacter indicus]
MDLWTQFITGDRKAFKELMETHVGPLFKYGIKFCREEELVRDTIQDLFIRLWERREHLSTEANAKAYLFASLRRMLFRKIQKQPDTVPYDNLEDAVNFFSMEISVEQRFISDERLRFVEQQMKMKIAALPTRQKEVIYLKFFMDMNREQISNIMQISPQTVSNLLQNALKKLRTDLRLILMNLLFFLKKK